MPLVLLGLIVFIGIVIYALVQYGNSDDTDDRPVRVKYPHVFNRHADDSSFDYEFDDEDEAGSGSGPGAYGRGHNNGSRSGAGHSGSGSGNRSGSSGSGNTMHFPDDAEVEKRKRNIH